MELPRPMKAGAPGQKLEGRDRGNRGNQLRAIGAVAAGSKQDQTEPLISWGERSFLDNLRFCYPRATHPKCAVQS